MGSSIHAAIDAPSVAATMDESSDITGDRQERWGVEKEEVVVVVGGEAQKQELNEQKPTSGDSDREGGADGEDGENAESGLEDDVPRATPSTSLGANPAIPPFGLLREHHDRHGQQEQQLQEQAAVRMMSLAPKYAVLPSGVCRSKLDIAQGADMGSSVVRAAGKAAAEARAGLVALSEETALLLDRHSTAVSHGASTRSKPQSSSPPASLSTSEMTAVKTIEEQEECEYETWLATGLVAAGVPTTSSLAAASMFARPAPTSTEASSLPTNSTEKNWGGSGSGNGCLTGAAGSGTAAVLR